jgi:hypothetical protein
MWILNAVRRLLGGCRRTKLPRDIIFVTSHYRLKVGAHVSPSHRPTWTLCECRLRGNKVLHSSNSSFYRMHFCCALF